MSILDIKAEREAPVEDGIRGLSTTPQPSGNADQDWLKRAETAYTTGKNFIETDRRKAWIAALCHFRSKHAPGSIYESDLYKFRSRLFRPRSREAMKKAESACAAAFFSTADVVSIDPVWNGSAESRAAAQVVNELVNHRLNNDMPWFHTVIGAFQATGIHGICCSKQYWRYATGPSSYDGLCVELIPPDRLLFDPNSDWIDPVCKSPWLIYRMPITKGEIKRRAAAGEWKEVSDQVLSMCRVDTSDPMTGTPKKNDVNSMQPMKDHESVWVHENIMRDDAGLDIHYWTVGDGKAMLSQPRPLAEVYLHCGNGKRPFVVGSSDIEVFNPYPAGKMEQVKDLQVATNRIQNMRIDGVSMGLYSRLFVDAANAGSLAAIGSMPPGGIAAVSNPQNIREIKPADVHQSAYVEQQYLNNDFDAMAGTFGQSSVSTNRELNETVGGMQLLASSANSVTEYGIRAFSESWMEPVLRQIVDLVQAYESDVRVIAVAGGRAPLIRQGVDVELDRVFNERLLVKVSVGVGATNPMTKMQNLKMAFGSVVESAMALSQIVGSPDVIKTPGFIEMAKELFGAAGFKDGERFLDLLPPPPEQPQPSPEEMEFQQKMQLQQAKTESDIQKMQIRHELKLNEMNDQQEFDKGRAILDAGLRMQATKAQMGKSKSPAHREMAEGM